MSYIQKFKAFIVALLCFGCGEGLHKFPETFLIQSTGFTDCEIQLIVEAVDRWQAATGVVDVDIEIVSYVGYEAHSIKSVWSWSPEAGGIEDENVLGFTWTMDQWKAPKHGQISLIVDRLRKRTFSVFLNRTMHELGHHYGLGHSPDDRPAVMHSMSNNDPPCITAQDLLQFCMLYGCVAPMEDPQCNPTPECH